MGLGMSQRGPWCVLCCCIKVLRKKPRKQNLGLAGWRPFNSMPQDHQSMPSKACWYFFEQPNCITAAVPVTVFKPDRTTGAKCLRGGLGVNSRASIPSLRQEHDDVLWLTTMREPSCLSSIFDHDLMFKVKFKPNQFLFTCQMPRSAR
jgi:hypothetical protein